MASSSTDVGMMGGLSQGGMKRQQDQEKKDEARGKEKAAHAKSERARLARVQRGDQLTATQKKAAMKMVSNAIKKDDKDGRFALRGKITKYHAAFPALLGKAPGMSRWSEDDLKFHLTQVQDQLNSQNALEHVEMAFIQSANVVNTVIKYINPLHWKLDGPNVDLMEVFSRPETLKKLEPEHIEISIKYGWFFASGVEMRWLMKMYWICKNVSAENRRGENEDNFEHMDEEYDDDFSDL